MTCSDEELDDRRHTQRLVALIAAAQARGFKMNVGYDTAAFVSGRGYIYLSTLTVSIGRAVHGPFSTVEEALNMLLLLGGGPE